LPLLCLPIDLSDEAAATLVEFLHELTEKLECHYAHSLSATTPTDILSAISIPHLNPPIHRSKSAMSVRRSRDGTHAAHARCPIRAHPQNHALQNDERL